MKLDPARTPVVLATGQVVDRAREDGPLELAERAARLALDQVPGAAARIERVSVVNILARGAGRAPASELAEALGLGSARLFETTVIGGTMPQTLVTRAAADIASGRLSATLIAGAEALRSTHLKAQRPAGGGMPATRDRGALPAQDRVFGLVRQDLSDEERAAGFVVPVFVYPLFESVLTARAGRSNAAQRRHLSAFLAPLSAVASSNPYAWFTDELPAEAIGEPAPDNRLVAEPYTKRMVAFLGSAHGSGLVVTSLEVARDLGRGDDVIFVWPCADSEEIWNPISRPDLGRAPALGAAARGVFAAADVSVDDIAHFDLYSCFPSAIEVAAAELGVALDDPRGLTVAGGLPYFGGPGSNYVSHSIATMVERLKDPGTSDQDRRSLGLVTGVSWYLTKHAVGLYGTEPPGGGGFRIAEPVYSGPAPEPVQVAARVEEATRASVDAGTVIYDRSGEAQSAPVIATLPDGTRVAATAEPEDLPAAAALASQAPLVGQTVQLSRRWPARYRVT